MSLIALKASLALWRRRYAYRDRKVRAAGKAHNVLAFRKWTNLLGEAAGRIHLRERQIAKVKPTRPVDWMPGVEHRPRMSAGSHAAGYAHKICWHVTEGDGDPTPTLDGNGDQPNFAVFENGHIVQYMPVGVAGKSLVHGNGGYPETNKGGPCQVEVCGFTARPNWPAAQIQACRRLARFIEANHGVERASHVKFHPIGSVRLGDQAWQRLAGHHGHMHVPNGNDHTDPGPIDTTGVLAALLS